MGILKDDLNLRKTLSSGHDDTDTDAGTPNENVIVLLRGEGKNKKDVEPLKVPPREPQGNRW